MVLFDIVREINDKISFISNRGLPGSRTPYLIGVTDGYNTLIQFMGQTVWDSKEWEYLHDDVELESNPDNVIKIEMERIRKHVITETQKLINNFFSIQLDV